VMLVPSNVEIILLGAHAGRECDPDVCMHCACAVTGEEPAQGRERCQNMQIRLRQHKRTAIAMSSIAGWGAFLLVSILMLQVSAGLTIGDMTQCPELNASGGE